MSNDPSARSAQEALVLIVEEDEGVRTMLEMALSSHGFSVVTANDGATGLETFRRHSANNPLVLMDVNMPVMSGIEALRQMKKECPDVRCFFMSGDTGLGDIPTLLSLGALGVLAKPFSSLQSLVETLRRSCGKREKGDNS